MEIIKRVWQEVFDPLGYSYLLYINGSVVPSGFIRKSYKEEWYWEALTLDRDLSNKNRRNPKGQCDGQGTARGNVEVTLRDYFRDDIVDVEGSKLSTYSWEEVGTNHNAYNYVDLNIPKYYNFGMTRVKGSISEVYPPEKHQGMWWWEAYTPDNMRSKDHSLPQGYSKTKEGAIRIVETLVKETIT